MRGTTRLPAALALAALLLMNATAPAAASDVVDAVVEGLEAATERLDTVTGRAERRMDADWEPNVATAVNMTSLERLERAIALSRVAARDALVPLIGVQSTGAVQAAITSALWDEDMGYLERRDHTQALEAWSGFRYATDDAARLRDVLRGLLGLPAVTGLRVCPFEEVVPFESDWGERRSWWRNHRGNDLNAPEGTRLVAMERGEVIQMGWHWLGGNGLYIRGDVTGDVYYYAHLAGYADGIDVGTPVETGQLVAYVGSTGNSDIPHLHLGWMPQAGEVNLDLLEDAYDMLVELCF